MKRTIKILNPEIFKKCSLILILILLLCHMSEKTFTQSRYDKWNPSVNNGFETWTRASFEKKLRKKIFFKTSPGVRINNNNKVFKSLFSDFNLYYRYKKYLRFSLGYRVTLNSNIVFHRIFGQVYYKNEIINNLMFTYRARIDREFTEIKLPDNALRNKIVLNYDLKSKADPFIASEIIYKIHYKGNYFNKIRFDVGFIFDIGKRKELNLFYRYQKELNEKNPLQLNIIGIKYAYSFN